MPRLTDAKIAALEKPEKGRRHVFDEHRDAPPGFGVRITSAGRRVFVLRYRSKQDGKDRMMNIGEVGTWSLAAARKQAREYRQEIDTGADILEKRREQRGEVTVGEAADRFLETKKDLASYASIRAIFHGHIKPGLGKHRMAAVRKHHIIEAVEDVAAKHGRTAALTLTYTKQLFRWAEDRGLIEFDVSAGIKPGSVSARLSPKRRDRILSPTEIAALWNRETPPESMHPLILLILKMTLATGQRPGEVAGMTWDEVRGDLWTIPSSRRGKTETAHTVPLTATALGLLEKARERTGGRVYVFGAKGDKAPGVSAVSKALLRCADQFVMEGGTRWRPHDLRRTMRTGLAAAGVSETVAEQTIGHVRTGIAAVYDLHRYDLEKRAALETWERRLLRIASGETSDDNVVSIAEGRA